MKFDIDGLDKLHENIQQVVQKGVDELNKGLDKFNDSVNERSASGSSQTKSTVTDTCPNCSAKLVSLGNGVKKCEYCGSEFGSARQNTSGRTMMDSVFDFVEKQQHLNMETQAQRIEKERIKAEIKLKKMERRHRRSAIRKLFTLVFLIVFGYYCYTHQDVVNTVIQIISAEFM